MITGPRVEYAKIALDVLNQSTPFGKTAHIHLETAARNNGLKRDHRSYYEGISNIFSFSRCTDPKQNNLKESSDIAQYHYDGLKLYNLPKEAWGGALFEEFGGSGSWMKMSGYNIGKDISVHNIADAIYKNEEYNGVNSPQGARIFMANADRILQKNARIPRYSCQFWIANC